MSTIWRNIDKVTGLPFEHLWRILGGAVAAALALGGGLVAPQAMAISTSLLLAVVLLSALCLGLHYSFCSCTPPRYKTCTRLNFRSKSLANIELAHRATSSGGRGQRFESSRARHSKPIKSIGTKSRELILQDDFVLIGLNNVTVSLFQTLIITSLSIGPKFNRNHL